MPKHNKKIIDLYSQLGIQYIKDLAKGTSPEIYDFIKLIPKGGRILEIGCAGGRDSKIFAQKGFKVVGIDLVDIFLKEARKLVPQAKFIKMDLLDLKFPKNYFDAIWVNAVLVHIKKKDVPKALKNLYQVLKPRGKIHLREKRGKGIKVIKEKLSQGKTRRFTFYTEDELKKYLEKSGFKIITLGVFPDTLGRKHLKWAGVWAEK